MTVFRWIHRITEFGLVCCFLVVAMVLYKKAHGLKVVW